MRSATSGAAIMAEQLLQTAGRPPSASNEPAAAPSPVAQPAAVESPPVRRGPWFGASLVRLAILGAAGAIVVLFAIQWDRWVGLSVRQVTDDAYAAAT
jgi:hypothetical protein